VTDPEVPDPGSRGHRARLTVTSFPEFYKQWWPSLVRCVISQASDTRWAEDIAQDTMMAASDNWEQLLTYERPDAWLFKVAIRSLRRLEARARERGQLPDDSGSATGDLCLAAATDDWVAGHLDIVAAIRSLPRRQGELVFLHGICHYTYAEAAQILGIGEPTAKEHFRRARERLGELLEGHGRPEYNTRKEHRRDCR
jgi:RNA polymerase sigma factor (sigma-70 family)